MAISIGGRVRWNFSSDVFGIRNEVGMELLGAGKELKYFLMFGAQLAWISDFPHGELLCRVGLGQKKRGGGRRPLIFRRPKII